MRRVLGAVGALALMGGGAHANLFDTFGAGARAQAMAGASVAIDDSPYAAYSNPAALALGPTMLAFGLTGNFNRTSILLKPRPSGYDPPGYGLTSARRDTENPGGVAGFTVGFNLKLFDDSLAIGGALLLPVDGFGFTDSAFSDERAQYFDNRLNWELLGTRLNTEVMSFGLAYRLFEKLSMGLGVLVLPENTTINQVYTPNGTDPSSVELNLNIEQGARWAITAGVTYEPLDWLRLAVSFQDEMYFGVSGYNRVIIRGEEDEPVRQTINIVDGYSPPRFTGALALLDVAGVNLDLEGTYRAWSRYLGNHGEQTDFSDTVEWRLGLEYPFSKRTRLRAGAGWAPSPIGAQDGRTNYIDNDRVVLSGGAGRDFEIMGEVITVDVGMQLHSMITRDVDKRVSPTGSYPACGPEVEGLCDELPDGESLFVDPRASQGLQTGNPGFPGFTHGGYVITAAIDLKWRF
ncbi:MAG: outer membrane protein transport protein [Myxococcales bacterium]|nr:outer membrane protein transport protein [Myxococcales bacterium]